MPTKHDQKLDALAAYLRGKSVSARNLARIFKTSKPTIYARLEALETTGTMLLRQFADEHTKRGPAPVLYGLPL